ncbi:hypothetical protein GCM10011391_03060 [Pullulanibacillus camelliae]|uniref:DUF871 domain-containing protein n=1 Tax=Pullulanibacillus camelliae TaxID=1707096 RepID=A0A8J2YF53_9BACL|nr:MupG family TIM beta-alpha barrel fold protein [Pullulanibacillus camelliae]GGE27945.1 hypothetical protein GCM10011391_03060 [Pullulanibacillus camelliae]
MFGFSVYLNEDWSQEKAHYINKMADIGFEGIFTSLHIPEDDASKYRERLMPLLNIVRSKHLKLMIDISGDALKHIGLSIDHPEEIVASGIYGLRMDAGIELKAIAHLSNYLTVGLNASTITEEDYLQLEKYQANFDRMEAWHNYYPRPETGLDETWFHNKNEWLKLKRFNSVAFAPGDQILRAPLYETLPTLEIHRYQRPLSAALSLQSDYSVDHVYIGDPGLSDEACSQFTHYLQHNVLLLHAANIKKKWRPYICRGHRNRLDVAKAVIRSEQSRVLNKDEDIPPENTVHRRGGSITIDNNLYKRYKGELQLVKQELPADEKVNVLGQIVDKDLPLLDFVHAGTAFKIAAIQGGA